MSFTAATTTYDVNGFPAVTLTRDVDGGLLAVVDITGLEPTRTTTSEERTAGVTSLDPPTVAIAAKTDRAKTVRALIDGAVRAVWASAASTLGTAGGMGDLVVSGWRTSVAVKQALRAIDEDV